MYQGSPVRFVNVHKVALPAKYDLNHLSTVSESPTHIFSLLMSTLSSTVSNAALKSKTNILSESVFKGTVHPKI